MMGCCSTTVKEWNTDACYAVDEDKPWKHYTKWKKPDTKDDIFYDSIYVKYPEEVNP